MKKIIKDAIILTIITLIAGFSLGVVYDVTLVPIEKAKAEKKQKAYQSVMSVAKEFTPDEVDSAKAEAVMAQGYDKQSITEVVDAKNESGEVIGYVITVVSNQGFGGPIEMSIGISSENNGEITGVDFLGMSESPGLGDNAKKPEFKDQYVNKTVNAFKVIKETPTADEEILSITGATITSEAVTKGVNAALVYYQEALAGGNK